MSWTDKNVELLRQLWLDGRSCSQISAALGHSLTRNAVIGKVHRLGLAGRRKGGVQPRAPRPPLPRPPKPAVVRVPSRAPVPVPVVPFECALIMIAELNQGVCRWPLGSGYYCGLPAPWRAPYCAHHAKLSYQPRTALRPLSRLATLR